LLKILTIMTFAALLLVFNLGETALAQMGPRFQQSGSVATCPAGTCAKNGGQFAKDVKYCSASNCKKPR
jgi:hypothetical protein